MNIAVISGKGGTGKTTFSVNLSWVLSRERPGQITLVDLDVEEPDVTLFTGGKEIDRRESTVMVPSYVPEKCTSCGLCGTLCEFNALVQYPGNVIVFPELCHACYACSELCPEEALPMVPKRTGDITTYSRDGLTVVEGRLDIGIEQATPLIAQTKEHVLSSSSGGDIVFDAPPGTSCSMMESVQNMDAVVVLAEPTPFGFNDFQLVVKALRDVDIPAGVVINKADLGDEPVAETARQAGLSVFGSIPYAGKTARLYAGGAVIAQQDEVYRAHIEQISRVIFGGRS